MKLGSFIIICLLCLNSYDQSNEKITTIETVKILNNNEAEAIYYFQNNWKVLRRMAKEKGYIDSFQLLQTDYSDETPFHLVLVTTYTNLSQFEKREENFGELIALKGGLKLLNDKQPAEFRKSVFAVKQAKHLE